MATQDPTDNYNWNLPDVAGDVGAWGALLNAIIGDDVTGIDAVLQAVSDVADAALPLAGGVLTGEVTVKTDKYDVVDSGNLTGAVTFDLSAARFFYGTVTGDVTSITFSNTPATGKAVFVVLEITNGGSQTITWPSSIKWPGNIEPTLTSSGVDVLSFYTRDGGTTWRGALTQEDSR